MRIVVAEELTQRLLLRYAPLIASADACSALLAQDGLAALEVLDDPKWQAGDSRLFDALDSSLAVWAHGLAAAQSRSKSPLGPVERSMIAYGLQVRLRGAWRARGLVERILAVRGPAIGPAQLDVIASDPYLRDAFVPRRLNGAAAHLHLHAEPKQSALLASVRERAVATSWLRTIELASGWFRRSNVATPHDKSLGIFVSNQRSLEMFEPIREELLSRGWHVTVFHYKPITAGASVAVEFGKATRFGRRAISIVRSRQWSIDTKAVALAPVSRAAISRALDASWITAQVQVERHRRVLEAWRPDVVASFGPDTMSLALQEAARRRGIPSIFLPHGFLVPAPTLWSSVHATATAVPGWPCVRENAVNPLGERQEGLVVVGHPNYDEVVRRPMDRRAPPEMSALRIPRSRPHLVVLFVQWSVDLLGYLSQRRVLTMAAKALPLDALLLCKLHPSREEPEMCERVLSEVLERDAFRVISDREFRTPDLLRFCEVAVASERSMSLSDAVVAGVPSIAIRDPLNPFGTGNLLHPAQDYRVVCRVVTDVEALRSAMTTLTRDPAGRAHLVEQRQAYIDEFLFASDGRSSARTADLVEHVSAGKAPEAFVAHAGDSLLSS